MRQGIKLKSYIDLPYRLSILHAATIHGYNVNCTHNKTPIGYMHQASIGILYTPTGASNSLHSKK
jgi:hypothetical protein